MSRKNSLLLPDDYISFVLMLNLCIFKEKLYFSLTSISCHFRFFLCNQRRPPIADVSSLLFKVLEREFICIYAEGKECLRFSRLTFMKIHLSIYHY